MRMYFTKKIFSLVLLFVCIKGFSQQDSIKKKFSVTTSKDSTVLFTGHRITEKEVDTEVGKLEIGGYVSTYYSYYSDETSTNGFVQFPTMAPRNNQVGLNMALISMNYLSKSVRANVNLHYGDVAESVWPDKFKMIQSAHAGVKLVKGLWLDAGFFRSHIGIESTQPRENVTSSMAVLSYNEPYYFSGAKLTYHLTPKLNVQLNVFNTFGGFVENNKNKVLGFSALYDLNENTSITYNFSACDETPDEIKTKHQRFYHDLYASVQLNKLSLGVEMNYGNQKNSLLSDTNQTAHIYSGLIVAKYQIIKKLAAYGRAEYFSDNDRILTGSLSIGKFIYGGTLGLEYKPLKNVSLSLEGRLLESDNLIFKTKGYYLNQRSEIIGCLDIWF